MTLMRFAAALFISLAPACAFAQARPSGNDCTLITDPTLLRQGVERFRDNESGPRGTGFAPDAFSPVAREPGRASAKAAPRQEARPEARPEPQGQKAPAKGHSIP